MEDPVGVAVSGRGEELVKESLDFGLEEGSWHQGEEGFEVVFDEVHDDEDSVKREGCEGLSSGLVERNERERIGRERGRARERKTD